MNDSLRERLRRLRRETAAPDVPAAPAPEARLGDPADLDLVRNARGTYALRRVERGVGTAHGRVALAEVDGVDADALVLVARDDALARFAPRDAVYLDIETTGLSGGSGTIPFQVGLGWFEGERFVLWQGLLRHPGEEAAMLADVAARVASSSALVSFFGKSFDRHRLEDKMRVHGIEPPFEGRPHLDLYHPCRALYGDALPDGRLATMERDLCGVEREDDLPGAFAPEAWYDWLAGRAHRVEDVLAHNRDDVLSLVTLCAHVGRVLAETRPDGAPLEGSAAARARGLARRLADAKRDEDALVWAERARERGDDSRATSALRATLLERCGGSERAANAWEALAAGADAHALRACVRLAMHAEHGLRDVGAACVWCERARAVLDGLPLFERPSNAASELDRREARLRAQS